MESLGVDNTFKIKFSHSSTDLFNFIINGSLNYRADIFLRPIKIVEFEICSTDTFIALLNLNTISGAQF